MSNWEKIFDGTKTALEISTSTGLSLSYIYKLAKRKNLPLKNGFKKDSYKGVSLEQLKKEIDESSIEQVANKYKFEPGLLKRKLMRSNIKIKKDLYKSDFVFEKKEKQEMYRMIRYLYPTVSQAELGRFFNLSRERIRQIIQDKEIEDLHEN